MARIEIKDMRLLRTGEAAKRLNITYECLRRWVQLGYVNCGRSPGGQALFSNRDIEEIREAIEEGAWAHETHA